MSSTIYDIAIIGAGAAGMNLALALASDSFSHVKKILVLERGEKTSNDRTWCWWEKENGKFDQLLHHSWSHGRFVSKGFEREFSMAPYRYKMLRSANFYGFTKKKIADHPSFTWIREEIKDVSGEKPKRLQGVQGSYLAKLVFDSRIPVEFNDPKQKRIHLLQHFKGWFIRTEKPVFNPAVFTQFDFRLRWPGSTSFTYVLPTNAHEALVEFTFFSPTLVQQEDYEKMLHRYLAEVLSLPNFEIKEVEFGIIPMSTFPFEKYHIPGHIRIGTAGGWVKPSTGYSFRNAMVYSEKIVANLKTGKAPEHDLISTWHRWMGSLLLDILFRQNEMGPKIFTEMYRENSIQQIFKFLDEETSRWEDLRIIAGFTPWPFLAAAARHFGLIAPSRKTNQKANFELPKTPES